MEKGTPLGMQPSGSAPGYLRLEARLPLYGNDIDDTTTPSRRISNGSSIQKGDFLGRDVLVNRMSRGSPASSSASNSWTGGSPGPLSDFLEGARRPGLFGTFAPLLKKSIGTVYLPIGKSAVGTEFEIGSGTRKSAPGRSSPFTTDY